MKGKDVAYFQRKLNERFHAWDVAFALDVDGAYGSLTREATSASCTASASRGRDG